MLGCVVPFRFLLRQPSSWGVSFCKNEEVPPFKNAFDMAAQPDAREWLPQAHALRVIGGRTRCWGTGYGRGSGCVLVGVPSSGTKPRDGRDASDEHVRESGE